MAVKRLHRECCDAEAEHLDSGGEYITRGYTCG